MVELIQGADTSTACFLGQAVSGPLDRPVLVHGLPEFEREFGSAAGTGFLWHAARAFFVQGGRRLQIQRVAGDGVEDYVSGLRASAAADAVAIVAAPGSTLGFEQGRRDEALAVLRALASHAEQGRRFAVLDAGDAQSPAQVRALRAELDSTHAALYWPWVTVGGTALPPSGFVSGIYARVDAARGVWKAPANEPVDGVDGVDWAASEHELDAVASAGVNPIRTLRGSVLVWGARTLSTDAEWKYVPVRRYVLFLEHSLALGLRFAVFEPNGEPLWARVRAAVETFLFDGWRSGALVGVRPADAFFVRCDRTTMTQADIDAGRLVLLVGIALVRPAEFTIVRIDQRGGATSGFERPRFLEGQLLTAADLQREQEYFRSKSRLHNRLLLGSGVVEGLTIEPAGTGGGGITVQPGVALDPIGREIVIPAPDELDLTGLGDEWWPVVLLYDECETEAHTVKEGYRLHAQAGAVPEDGVHLGSVRIQRGETEIDAHPRGVPSATSFEERLAELERRVAELER